MVNAERLSKPRIAEGSRVGHKRLMSEKQGIPMGL
jgi:hypothetical protein